MKPDGIIIRDGLKAEFAWVRPHRTEPGMGRILTASGELWIDMDELLWDKRFAPPTEDTPRMDLAGDVIEGVQ